MNRTHWSRPLLVALLLAATPAAAPAATIVEYFNNYGTTDADSNGLGSAGDGWAGAWTAGSNRGAYRANTALSFTGAGFTAPANETGTNDGTLAAGSSAGVANTIFRAFDVDPVTVGNQGLTGTIWLSALVNVSRNGKDIFMVLDNNSTNDALALRGSTGLGAGNTSNVPEPVIKYNGGTDASSTVTFAAGVTHLFLAKIVIDASGTSDTIDFWINPTLGATGPTSPTVYSKSGSNPYGTSFDGVGFTFASAGGSVDAIRISNDANAYEAVVGIPEPGTALLLAAAGLLALTRRHA